MHMAFLVPRPMKLTRLGTTLLIRNSAPVNATRNAQHPFAVKLNKNRTSAYANSFTSMASRDWKSLPATVSPRLITFSCLRPTSTDSFNSYPAHKIPSSSTFHDGGANQGLWGMHLFGVSPSLINIIKKKKFQKMTYSNCL